MIILKIKFKCIFYSKKNLIYFPDYISYPVIILCTQTQDMIRVYPALIISCPYPALYHILLLSYPDHQTGPISTSTARKVSVDILIKQLQEAESGVPAEEEEQGIHEDEEVVSDEAAEYASEGESKEEEVNDDENE